MVREGSSEKSRLKTVIAVAHEMLGVVYSMLKCMEPYRGEKRDFSWRKIKGLEHVAVVGLGAVIGCWNIRGAFLLRFS